MALDFHLIQEDLKNLLVAGPAAGYTSANQPKHVYVEAMEREGTFDSMPFINIRLVDAEMEIRSLPNGYYGLIIFEIDVVAFDFTHFKKAANIRDDLVREAWITIQETAAWSSVLSTSQLGNIRFLAGTQEGAGGHVAIATFQVTAEAYVEPT